jgi:hypothetical protein
MQAVRLQTVRFSTAHYRLSLPLYVFPLRNLLNLPAGEEGLREPPYLFKRLPGRQTSPLGTNDLNIISFNYLPNLWHKQTLAPGR